MPTTIDHRIRLVCKARPDGGEIGEILEALKHNGWSIEGSKLSKGSLEAEIIFRSLSGDELALSPKFTNLGELESLLKTVIASCWYIDVYHYLRGELAKEAADRLEVSFDAKKVVRKREAGADLKLEVFPSIEALTISYRLGWSEFGKGAFAKIYEKIFGEKAGPKLVKKLLRWRR